MVETALLEESKETDNKVRWDADIEGTTVSLYIPKWRVPEPWPGLIHVTVSPGGRSQSSSLSEARARRFPELLKQPVVARIKKFEEKTQTIRYQPEGDRLAWEIGEPYIPTPMTYDGAQRLLITMKWEPSR